MYLNFVYQRFLGQVFIISSHRSMPLARWEGAGKNLSSWQSQPGCLCLTSAFPSPHRYIAFLLCCLSLIDAVICVLRQPELINPSKHPVIKKGSHLQLQGGEKGSLCFCFLAVLVQAESLEAGDSAWVCGVTQSVSSCMCQKASPGQAEISKAAACRN